MMKIAEEDKRAIRELCRTKYDEWVEPPPMDLLTHMLPFKPKNYSSVSFNQLSDFIIKNFEAHEPLISKLSDENKNILINSIRCMFGRINFLDFENGGDGLIKPTFMEIMSNYIFNVRENKNKDLITDADKSFFHKYFWCFHEKAIISVNYFNKSA